MITHERTVLCLANNLMSEVFTDMNPSFFNYGIKFVTLIPASRCLSRRSLSIGKSELVFAGSWWLSIIQWRKSSALHIPGRTPEILSTVQILLCLVFCQAASNRGSVFVSGKHYGLFLKMIISPTRWTHKSTVHELVDRTSESNE